MCRLAAVLYNMESGIMMRLDSQNNTRCSRHTNTERFSRSQFLERIKAGNVATCVGQRSRAGPRFSGTQIRCAAALARAARARLCPLHGSGSLLRIISRSVRPAAPGEKEEPAAQHEQFESGHAERPNVSGGVRGARSGSRTRR